MEQLNTEQNSRTAAQNNQSKQKSMEVKQASKRDLPEPAKQEQVPAISAAQIISNVYANIDQMKDEKKVETPTLKQKSPAKSK